MTDGQEDSQGHDSQSSFRDLMDFILENPAPEGGNAQNLVCDGQPNETPEHVWAQPVAKCPTTNIEEYLNLGDLATSSGVPAQQEEKVEMSPDSGYLQPYSNESVANSSSLCESYIAAPVEQSRKLYEILPQPMLPSSPPKTNYPGDYGFEALFDRTDSAPKNVNYTYSHSMKKLYSKMMVACPVQFHCKLNPPAGSFIRAMMVFLLEEHTHECVTRCPSHMMKPDSRPHLARHLLQIVFPPNGYDPATYDEFTLRRSSVIIPFSNPSVGEQHFTVLYKFMCRSSCVGGINRRPVGAVFTLEDRGGKVLGRCFTEVKICSAPGRDRRVDEDRKCKSGGAKTPIPLPKKPKMQLVEPLPQLPNLNGHRCGDDFYLLRIKGREKYELLKKINDALSFEELATEAQREQVRQQENHMFKDMLSSYLAQFST